jgi:hypothetical protein
LFQTYYRQKIENAQKPSGLINKPITVPLGGSGRMYGIVSVPEHCPRCKYTRNVSADTFSFVYVF